jgi:hypothetical protein
MVSRPAAMPVAARSSCRAMHRSVDSSLAAE